MISLLSFYLKKVFRFHETATFLRLFFISTLILFIFERKIEA